MVLEAEDLNYSFVIGCNRFEVLVIVYYLTVQDSKDQIGYFFIIGFWGVAEYVKMILVATPQVFPPLF